MIQAPPSPSAYKINHLFWAMCITFSMIAVRLFVLQIKLSETFLKQGERNFIRTERIASPRGNIVDRNGILLVTNRPVNSLYWKGSGNRTLTSEQKEIVAELEQILGINLYQDEPNQTELQQAERRYKKMLLTRDLTIEQLGKIQERIPEHANLVIDTDFERLYPFRSFASHTLGYLSGMQTGHEGRMGIEKVCDDLLKGQDGASLKIINSFGKSLSETTIEQPNVGAEIRTTIDATLQSIVEEVFPKIYAGAFIIMNPADGAILALCSQPTFDPNIFLKPILPDEWQTIQSTKQPFINRAFSSHYPPGSIFKLVTLSAALENGLLTQDSTVYCSGNVTFAGRKYWCHNKHGHGRLTAGEALEHSCNVMCYDIARRIDIDTLADYAHRFGLGQKTDSVFPEKDGLVPSRAWKRGAKGEKWWPGETLSASIGQSFLLVTPIQVARMIGSIFTRYLVKPRILADEPIEKTPLNIRLETLEFLRNSMQKVVTSGTGRMSKVRDVQVYAKTSTAQNSDLSKRDLGEQFLEHGWFVSHFSYKHHPPLTIVIILENVGSSSVPTGVAKNFFIEYKKRMDQVTT